MAEARPPLPPQRPASQQADIEQAWTIKAACYAAWLNDPAATAGHARALAELASAAAAEPEIQAVAAWTAGIADLVRGAMSEAVAGFDRASAGFLQIGQPLHAAQAQVPKTMALSFLGLHDEACACAEQTLQVFTAQGDTISAAKVRLNLGSLYLHRDAYAASAGHYREAAVLFARSGQMQHSVMADIGVADAITALGDFDEAARMYERARLRASHHGLPVLGAIVQESIALLELARGAYQPALAGLERARRAYEQLEMPQQLVLAEKQLADAYLALRLLPEALALYEAALPRFTVLEMLPEQAWTLAQRGRALALLGRADAASASLQSAAALFAGQDNPVGDAAVALARAELAAAGGDPAQALQLAQAAMRGYGLAAQAEGQLRAELAAAQAWLALGQLAQAATAFQACLARSRALGVLPPQVHAHTGLGQVARQRGDQTAARLAFQSAVLGFEEQRQAVVGDEFRQALLADHLRPYRELLAIALQDEAAAASAPERVLQQLEQVRARSMGERLTGAAASAADTELPALRARLNWLYRRLRKVQEEGGASQPVADDLRRCESELLERARRELLASPDTGPEVARTGAVDLEALAQALRPDEALVEYGVDGDELFACVLRRTGVQLVRRLAGWREVVDGVQAALFQMDTFRHGSAPVARHLAHLERRAVQRLQQVHGLVWAPLEQALQGCRRVLVVPHAQLAALPFAALHDGSDYIGTGLQVAMAPSARIALHALQHPPENPVERQAERHALVVGESQRLPQAGAEARHVASLFPGSVCLVDEAATLDAVRAAAPAADVIHLACHAQFRSDNPMFSALHLRDGAITAEWLQGLRLKPAVVVLSACETGLAEQGQGDEMLGLVRAFMLAGAARVVAALWPVDDSVTEQFMAAFYRALAAGTGCAAALQRAQLEVRKSWPHPYFWAGFTVQAGW